MLSKHFRVALINAAVLSLIPSLAAADSVEFFANAPRDYDYTVQTTIPAGFGEGEFTFEVWIRPNENFPVGPVGGGSNQLNNWSNVDNAPYSSGGWWWAGNFLLDGHNNNASQNGSFDLQFYGGGRVRWLFGDGSYLSVGAYPATNTPSLLDGQWHQVTLVRRWSGATSATLELWVDGGLVATESSSTRTDMRVWWDNWAGFPSNQDGWFWGAEKQAAIAILPQYEDYKGLIDEIRFWSRAKSPAEITSGYADPVTGTESGLVGYIAFGEGSGTNVCDALAPAVCMQMINPFPNAWSAADAPLSGAGDTTPPSTPTGLQGNAVSPSQIDLSWNASTDNVAVTGYDVRRDGVLVTSTGSTSFSDNGLTANTNYSYTVAARDAAGNASAQSSAVNVMTPVVVDTQAPTVPTGLQGNAASPTQVDLSWNASTDNVAVTGYDVRRDGVLITSTGSTSFTDNGLTANTNYAYTVAARDAAGNASAQSSAVNIMTPLVGDTQAPTTPTGVQGNAASSSQIDLSWNASTDNVAVTGYDVRRDGVLITSAGTTSFSDNGLTANTNYAYTVAARDAAGNTSAESSVVNVMTPVVVDTQAPTTPAGLQGNAVSSSQINLTWNTSTDNIGVTGYDIQRDGITVDTSTNTSYSDTSLLANTSYVYTVIAKDDAGNQSAPSSSISAVTQVNTANNVPSGGGGSIGFAMLILLLSVRLGVRCRHRRDTTSCCRAPRVYP